MSAPLSERQLLNLLPILTINLDNVYTSHHAKQRMKERHISYDDALDAIQFPIALLDTRFDDATNQFKYKIHGVDKNKHIVIAIDDKTDNIHIVTVINKLYNY